MKAFPWHSPVFVYGPPGSGKTRVGQALAADLNLPFLDLDAAIEATTGTTIADLIATQGEPAGRQVESTCLREVLSNHRGVISLGGGALLDPANRQLVEENGPVVCLTAKFETLLERVVRDGETRPLLAGEPRAMLEGLLARRREHYASFSLHLATDELFPEEISAQAQVLLGLFRLPGENDGCAVTIQKGGLETCGETLQALGMGGPIALVSDENVWPLYGEQAARSLRTCGYAVSPVILPAGEAHKTVAAVADLWTAFLRAGLDRSSAAVSLGGGVVSDLAGFAAATYLRGIAWAAYPTSLLAMVDASLGGKTGADLPQGKNLVGAFHPPRAVVIDPAVLASLPEAELRSGLAETVKHGVIGDPRLFELCSGGWDKINSAWDEILPRSVAVKARIVREDPAERGRRAALNLGHTIGHAVESVSEYRLRHGEAVAVGMVLEARLAEEIGLAPAGLARQIAGALDQVGLPTDIPEGMPAEEIKAAMQVDKKRRSGQVKFALPAGIGDVRVGIAVPAELLDSLLNDRGTR